MNAALAANLWSGLAGSRFRQVLVVLGGTMLLAVLARHAVKRKIRRAGKI